jgi:predicted nucleic acid-binding protein
VIKWFIGEHDAESAVRWLDAATGLAAPDLLFAETANVLWKKVARREISAARAREVRGEIESTPFRRRSARELAAPALDLALETGRSVYDCVYLALALEEGSAFVTADNKFFAALKTSRLRDSVRWFGDAANR